MMYLPASICRSAAVLALAMLGMLGAGDRALAATWDEWAEPINVPLRLCPTHRSGDRDFDGRPSGVLGVELFISQRKDRILANVELDIFETKPDRTRARSKWTVAVYSAPRGTRIEEILSPKTALISMRNIRNGQQRGRGPVSNFTLTADTGGDDVGNCTDDDTRITAIKFRRLRLRVSGEQNCRTRWVWATLKPTGRLCPSRHVGGDAEFGGNGPRVTVSAELYTRDSRTLWMRAKMDARETKPDHTHVTMNSAYRVWQAPQGCRIKKIQGARNISQTYTDTNHAPDVLRVPAASSFVESFVVMGDTSGEDYNKYGIHKCRPQDTHLQINTRKVRVLIGE